MLCAVGGEEGVGEEAFEGVAAVARSVLDVVAHRLLELLHERLRRCTQLLDDLIPLVDI